MSRDAGSSAVTTIVRRGPLDVSIIERGQLDSANNLTLRCKIEGGGMSTLLRIVEDGSWVEQDQIVAELDASRLEDQATLQKIRLISIEALLKTAEGKAEIQKLVNENSIAAAELRLQLAKLDLQKFTDGEYVQQSKIVEGEITIATENLKAARQRVADTEELLRKGYSTTKQLEADKVGVTKSELALQLAQSKQRILKEFSYQRGLTEKKALAENAERDLERVKMQAQRAMAQCNIEVLARRRVTKIQQNYLKRINRQIAACVIRAPRSGIAVHANNPNGTRSSIEPLVYEGAWIREGQPVIQMPDLSQMLVRARIHESRILNVSEGAPVSIQVDAVEGESFRGVVEYISLMPQSAGFPNYDLKEYPAVIKVTDPSAALKPGMTAEVRILVERLESVLQVPVQACVERGGRYFAWLLEADRQFARREVKVGRSNESALEIVDGLCEGEEVVCNPRMLLPDEIAQLEQEVPEEIKPPTPEPSPAKLVDPWEYEMDPRDADAAEIAEAADDASSR